MATSPQIPSDPLALRLSVRPDARRLLLGAGGFGAVVAFLALTGSPLGTFAAALERVAAADPLLVGLGVLAEVGSFAGYVALTWLVVGREAPRVTPAVSAQITLAGTAVNRLLPTAGLGGIGLNVIQGARMVGANRIVGVDINPAREEWGRKFGMTDFVDGRGKDRAATIAAIAGLTDGGADYSFECIGNTTTMRQALECCHKGWGKSVIIGVAAGGQEINTRPFQLVTGRVWLGSAFGGARGRTDVPRIVDWYMDGKISIDPLITHTLKLDDINEAFALMERGESIRSVVVF
mgnify:CR=1 FL=1